MPVLVTGCLRLLHPHDSTVALGVPAVMFLAGVAMVVRQGERPAEPDDAAG